MWNKVEDKLPEPGTTVLVYRKERDSVTVGFINTTNEWWLSGACTYRFHDVTHWMPMPDRPNM